MTSVYRLLAEAGWMNSRLRWRRLFAYGWNLMEIYESN